MATDMHGKSLTVHLNTHDQKMESLQKVLATIGGMLGCTHCGRIALLRVDVLSDPPPELAKQGVLSYTMEQ